jgi:hypothetical protein
VQTDHKLVIGKAADVITFTWLAIITAVPGIRYIMQISELWSLGYLPLRFYALCRKLTKKK